MEAVQMKASEALRKARELITPEGAWTVDAFARTDKGRPIGPMEDAAKCWCTVGALRKVTDDDMSIVYKSINYIDKLIHYDIPEWNDADEQTQGEVLNTLDGAASLAEAEGH